MKAYVITIEGNEQSETSAARLIESSKAVGNEFPIDLFWATTPEDVKAEMVRHRIPWTYPWEGTKELPRYNLRLHPYNTKNREARMACFMSHFRLWMEGEEQPVLILEDDAVFTRKLDPVPLLVSGFHIIGLNDPRGATRRADLFHNAVQRMEDDVGPAPWVDEETVPQGLAGASAYLMTSTGASFAVGAARLFGAWPNDALLCKQLVPGLGVTKTYFCKVQGTRSTLA